MYWKLETSSFKEDERSDKTFLGKGIATQESVGRTHVFQNSFWSWTLKEKHDHWSNEISALLLHVQLTCVGLSNRTQLYVQNRQQPACSVLSIVGPGGHWSSMVCVECYFRMNYHKYIYLCTKMWSVLDMLSWLLGPASFFPLSQWQL